VDGVPAIVVNGKYRTSATQTGGNEQLMAVVNGLIAQESQLAKAEASAGNNP
jgi:thiol:disulfide interchange protein DsbA